MPAAQGGIRIKFLTLLPGMKLLEELVISNLPDGTTASWLRKFSSVQFKLARDAQTA